MKFEDYKFMQLFGNCACIAYLGENRIRGPVDNVIATDVSLIKLLLFGNYIEALNTTNYEKTRHGVYFDGDSPWQYTFPFVKILHNNPMTEKYKQEVLKRIDTLKKFYKKVLINDKYFFTITLNEALVDKNIHTINKKLISTLLKYLKELKILHKCIFIGTRANNKWNFWAGDFSKFIKEYNLKYFEINNLDLKNKIVAYNQFKTKFLELFKNTNKHKEKVVYNNYYLYF